MRDRAPHGKPTRRSAMRSPRAGLTRPSLERAQRHDGMRSQAPAAPRFAATSQHSPLRKPSTGISVSHGPTNALSATIARPCGYVRRTPPLDATGCDSFRHAMETYRERSPTISFVLRKRGTPVRSDGSHVTTVPALIRAFAATSGFTGIHFLRHPPPPRKPHVCVRRLSAPLHGLCTISLHPLCIAPGRACIRHRGCRIRSAQTSGFGLRSAAV